MPNTPISFVVPTWEDKSTTSLAIPAQRRALAEMYIDLTVAFYETIPSRDRAPNEVDADLTLVAVAVMLGHAKGSAMNASQIASLVHMPRTSVLRRLDALICAGLIERDGDNYFLGRTNAVKVPHRRKFELILSRAFAVLGPYLSKMDT